MTVASVHNVPRSPPQRTMKYTTIFAAVLAIANGVSADFRKLQHVSRECSAEIVHSRRAVCLMLSLLFRLFTAWCMALVGS